MLTDSTDCSLSTFNVALIWCNVVVNIYNVVIISLTDESKIQVLLGEDSEAKQTIVMIQTVVVICAIMISTVQKTSCLIFLMKFLVFGSSFAFLIIDILQTFMIAFNLFSHEKTLNAFWKIKTHSKESVAPDNLYFIIAVVLAIYLVFKFYVTYKIYYMGMKLPNGLFNDEYFLDQDVERNIASERIFSSELPPSYDECVTVDTSMAPPPYSVVQRY